MNLGAGVVSEIPVEMDPTQTQRLLLGLGLATSMEFYTYDAVNLVLPDMAGTFGVSQDQASWILTTYSSTLFLSIPLSIWMARHFGYLRYILGSSTVFVVASVGCALAADFQEMLVWRAVQGFSGAALTMWWRASIYMLLPKPQRGKSLMRISMMLYLASALGLLFSGWVTDNVNWRWIFIPNIVFLVAAIGLLLRHFPKVQSPSDPRVERVDKAGILLLGIALASLQVLLSRGEISDWLGSPLIQSLAWISATSLVIFILWESSARNDRRLFRIDLVRDRNVLASMLLGILAGMIISGSIYALPEYLRHVDPRELNATHTGQVMCVYAFTAALIRPLVTRSIGLLGQRKVLTFALTMLIISMIVFARLITTGTALAYFAIPLVLYAFCLAPLLSSVGGGTVGRVAQADQLDAVSIYMTFRQFGASLGITLISIILDRRESLHSARLFDHVRAGGALTSHWIGTVAHAIGQRIGYSSHQAHEVAVALLSETATRQAATLAYADAFVCMAGVGLVALCLVPLMSPTPVVRQ
jgi:MFS transporter, DHA2 family, multidrug resistance protein